MDNDGTPWTLEDIRSGRFGRAMMKETPAPGPIWDREFQATQQAAVARRDRYDIAAEYEAAGHEKVAAAWRYYAENPDLSEEALTRLRPSLSPVEPPAWRRLLARVLVGGPRVVEMPEPPPAELPPQPLPPAPRRPGNPRLG